MNDYSPSTYGDRIADIYDQLHAGLPKDPTVNALAKLAAGGRALELGIGTGRVATGWSALPRSPAPTGAGRSSRTTAPRKVRDTPRADRRLGLT